MTNLLYKIPGLWTAQTKLNKITSFIPPPKSETKERRRIVLVQCHPVEDSFSAAIGDTVESAASDAGHQIRRINLYEHSDPTKCFRPNLSRTERAVIFDKKATNYEGNLAPEIQSNLRLMQWCNTLVVVYPTWWMNTPASLKGFFDRTLLPGFAWDFPPEGSHMLRPRLTNVTKIVGVSTYGCPKHYVMLVGDNGRRMITNSIRPMVFSPDCTTQWLGLYDMDYNTEKDRKQFLGHVGRVIREL